MTIARIEKNEKLNGIEIYFTVYPLQGTKETLKKAGFRWNHKKSCWYAKQSDETLTIAGTMAGTDLCEYQDVAKDTGEAVREIRTPEPKAKATKASKENKYGVKVGDIFHMQWGYEQTNNDFFQVVELVGSSSIRVREISPEFESKAVSGMAEDRYYKFDKSKLYPPTGRSIFINDQERGDLKRLRSYAADGVSNPQFTVTSYADAYLVTGDTTIAYDSWYY